MRKKICLFPVLSLAILALVPSAASAFPWSDQADLQNETNPTVRSTYIVDGAPGSVIPRSLFLSQPYLGFYEGEGFDRNFFTWAPEASIGDEYMAGKGWTGCHENGQVPVPGGPSHCAPGEVRFGAPGSIRKDIPNGPLTGLKWGENFISDICGNWAPANTAPKVGPEPVISGVKYEDSNANGVRDSGEPGLSGWKIELFYEGSQVATTTTGAGGAYEFHLDANSMPIGGGTYELKEESREGWVQEQHPGNVVVPFGAGDAHYEGNDFGNWHWATIAGSKFDDSNVDGAWSEGESGLGGWGIQLSNGEETSTASDGSYSFSVRPGTYTVGETLRDGWRQTDPGGAGTREYTLTSGQVVEKADFGNVCLGSLGVEPFDDSSGALLSGLEVRLEEVSVPGILENEPSLPRTATGAPTFGELLPGTYRVVAFLPEGVFTTDPAAVLVEGRFAIFKEVTVAECEEAKLPLHLFTQSTPGKVTGGVKIALPGGFGTSGFEFMTRAGAPRGTLQYQDHVNGLDLHTSAIEAIYVSGGVAWVWGRVNAGGVDERFRLRLVDAGEPGREDRYELTVASGYEAGFSETLEGGNVQIHT